MVSTKSWLHVSAVAFVAVALAGPVLGVTFVARGQSAAPTVVQAAPASAPLTHAALLAPARAVVVPASSPAVVAAAPASQPAIKVPAGFCPWLQANGNWFIPLLIFVLSSLATVLSKYPRAKGLIAALRMFMGGLSMLEFKDGRRPGMVMKWPATLPEPPPGTTAESMRNTPPDVPAPPKA